MFEAGLFFLVVMLSLGAFYSDAFCHWLHRSLVWLSRRATGKCVPYCDAGCFETIDAAGNNAVYRCPKCGDKFIW